MTWILYFYRECYYDLRTYFRNLFKSSTEKWLEAELIAVDEALGFTAGSTRRHGDRISRIESLSQVNLSLRSAMKDLMSWYREEGTKLVREHLALDEQLEQMKERDKLKASWAEDAKKYAEDLKTWKDAYAHEHRLAEDLYKQASECQIERDKLKLELQDERKWSQEMARMADERGDKIGKLNDEIETLKNRRSELVNDKMRLVREVETYKDAYNTLKRQLEGAQE